MLKTICDICQKEIIDIIGAGKLIYFEKVSKFGEKGVEERVEKFEVDICCGCNKSILKIVKEKQKK